MARSTRRRVRTQEEEHRTGRALNVPGQEEPESLTRSQRRHVTRQSPTPDSQNRGMGPTALAALSPEQRQSLVELSRSLPRADLEQYRRPERIDPQLQRHHSPIMQLLTDFGVTDITPDELSGYIPSVPYILPGGNLPEGSDEPFEFLEYIANTLPLGEWYVPTTPRDILGAVAGGLAARGANRAMTGRRIVGTPAGSTPNPRARLSQATGEPVSNLFESTYGPTFGHKVAEHLNADTLARFADDADPSLLGRLVRYFYPNKPITNPRVVPDTAATDVSLDHLVTPPVSRRAAGVTDRKNLPIEQEIFGPRPVDPVQTSITRREIPIEGTAGTDQAARQLARSQAAKLRVPGASPQQYALGRKQKGIIERQALPARPHDPIERNLSRGDRDFLKSLGITGF